ncbi:MAG TPA: hypothetical protein VJV78_45895 [Polyangiales bacterium]|nr:hypothetical protein [Polyangiales bacterium]
MGNSNGGLRRTSWAFALSLIFACGLGLAACKGDAKSEGKTDPVPGKPGQEGGSHTMGSAGGKATETNVAPAPCDADDDCPAGIECYFPNGDAQTGFCDVNEMHVADAGSDRGGAPVSSAAPAPCNDDDDCPAGIECVSFDGGPGFCHVEEMGISPSSATPAPCMSQDDCPAGIKCVSFAGADGPGFCDVNEMIAP